MEKYIQIGVTALRDPATGKYLPSVPLYIKAEGEGVQAAEQAEESLARDIEKILAVRMKAYVDGCINAGVYL